MFFTRALREADKTLIGQLEQKVEKQTEEVDDFRRQMLADAEAYNLVGRRLNPNPDIPEVSQAELDKAIESASRHVRVQIFNQAWEVRGENWQTNKVKMERTIPIFRALISQDTEEKYHMNHGQLGFALKDKSPPEWKNALDAINIAIKRRKREGHWLFYEFNRAMCTIMLDRNYNDQSKSDEDQKRTIIRDLAAAAKAPQLASIIKDDEVVANWMKINKVSMKDLAK